MFDELRTRIDGDVNTDIISRIIYATDASAYREMPEAVVYPKSSKDLQRILIWANKHSKSIIPRAAGTSLAGQVVGNGIVVDTGRFLNHILSVDSEKGTTWVEPGVIRDELNHAVAPHKLHFAPETSTSNRCMIAGMIGNNACGAHSLIYGSTRDHLLEVKGYLSDGSFVHFKPLNQEEYNEKLKLDSLEGNIYRQLNQKLKDPDFRELVLKEYPHEEIRRRNTGYAIDELLKMEPFTQGGGKINLAPFIAGSEGTLMLISEAKLNLEEVIPPQKVLLCAHFNSMQEALEANILALDHQPIAIELMDDKVIECTKDHLTYKKNRFFLQGEPKAILIIEFASYDIDETIDLAERCAARLEKEGFGYHYPVIKGADIQKVWDLRKAGLGLLSNIKGDAKPVPVIEDTAVRPEDLPSYIREFEEMLTKLKLSCVYYAHIATGELHLRPVLNLKLREHVELFRTVALETAKLVKKYNGSLSGEHGDGRLRGEFIPLMLGEDIYQFLKDIKAEWDPQNRLNPEKIVDTPPMNSQLRYTDGYSKKDYKTVFKFDEEGGIQDAAEKCNGSGDCRRPALFGGAMCPSYQASFDEKLSTRARANVIREILGGEKIDDAFRREELKEILDQCLLCKACKSECPSSVDMAKLKAEVMHQYYQNRRIPLNIKLTAKVNDINKLLYLFSSFYNFLIRFKPTAAVIKAVMKVPSKRDLPKISGTSFEKWLEKNIESLNQNSFQGDLILFVDEFVNFYDAEIGIKTAKFFSRLGYHIIPFTGHESGRAAFSKGMLELAKKHAEKNVADIWELSQGIIPIVGIEPSALLSFRDEYPDMLEGELLEKAKKLKNKAFLTEEFILNEHINGRIPSSVFSTEEKEIVYHVHCHQKALSDRGIIKKVLEIPENFKANEINSGCCGMAGSFGMEKKNYDLSMKIGSLVLFPEIKKLKNGTQIATPGISCRHQIEDGTGEKALHPVEYLLDALNTL